MANIIGRITVNNKVIYEVDADPGAGGGTAAPRGSIAMYDSGVVGSLYVKNGSADTAWQQVDLPEGQDWELDGNTLTGGATTPNEFLGSVSDHDVAFQRNSTEFMRLFDGGVLIGLTATLGGRLQIGPSSLGAEILKETSPNGGSGARVVNVSRQYKVQTTDATQTALASLAIADGSRVQAWYRILCRQHGGTVGSVGDGADYIRTFSAKRDGGGAILNAFSSDFTEEDTPSSSFTVDEATNSNNIDVLVTGEADRNLAWSCHMEIMIAVD